MNNSTRVMQVSAPGSKLELVKRELRDPGPGEVRVRVEACGVCHSDAFTIDYGLPGLEYPRVPGHEIAWHDRRRRRGRLPVADGTARRCRLVWRPLRPLRSLPPRRRDQLRQRPGPRRRLRRWLRRSRHRAEERARVDPGRALRGGRRPLLCAGVTTFNALRGSGARPGDLVAILGIGGLGHLGVQFARRMGFETVAIARGGAKREQALRLGAHHYIDSTTTDVSEALQELGGAATILATVTAPDAMSAAVGGLRPRGLMLVIGASLDPMQIPPFALIPGSTGVVGHASGTSKDSEDTLRFSTLQEVRPAIETYPLEEAAAGYDRMMSGDARFRVVLTTGA